MSSTSRIPTVTVCRGCCCGTEEKVPGVDHDGQLIRLQTDIAGFARLVRSDCLDQCERANVVVVNPSPAARSHGAGTVWFGPVTEDDQLEEVVRWVRAGGPGVERCPRSLDRLRFKP